MAETLGSLCDKLSIVTLKVFHTDPSNEDRLKSLATQETQLTREIDEFLAAAVTGRIPTDRLCFSSNKVYRADGNDIPDISGDLGAVIGRLADVNCRLWHEQEKVYAFETVPATEKNAVVKNLAILNLERNACIDLIDRKLILLLAKVPQADGVGRETFEQSDQ